MVLLTFLKTFRTSTSNVNLKSKKTTPPEILKISCNTSAETYAETHANTLRILLWEPNLLNECLVTGDFPDNLKFADITTVFKKKDPLNKENYRPVSVLHIISRIFEKLMQKQINSYINNFLSP